MEYAFVSVAVFVLAPIAAGFAKRLERGGDRPAPSAPCAPDGFRALRDGVELLSEGIERFTEQQESTTRLLEGRSSAKEGEPMTSREDIESFLIRSELEHEEVEEGLWLVHAGEGGGEPTVAVSYTPPLLVLRSRMLGSPDSDEARLRLYRRLLELNATDLVHGAYGLENGEVILSDALELENLDFSEFQASLESLTLAAASHREQLLEQPSTATDTTD